MGWAGVGRGVQINFIQVDGLRALPFHENRNSNSPPPSFPSFLPSFLPSFVSLQLYINTGTIFTSPPSTPPPALPPPPPSPSLPYHLVANTIATAFAVKHTPNETPGELPTGSPPLPSRGGEQQTGDDHIKNAFFRGGLQSKILGREACPGRAGSEC